MNDLNNSPTTPPIGVDKMTCKNLLMSFHKKLFDLQNKFYADGRYGLIIILQGVDTSGKDGTIRHVMTCMNPMGVVVKSFKKPTEEEEKHDFLWRIYPHIPSRSMIQVFNRSYYEDILVPVITNTLSDDKLQHRIDMINQLENHLEQNNIHVLKLFLHISKNKQEKRISERLLNPAKQWKYSKDDNIAASKFDEYIEVYDSLIKNCTESNWHIIPSDKRWYRNYLVAEILTSHLENLNLNYPQIKK